ncbi:DNA-3-methyladenine glycosylase family protein [Paenibacillus sp. DMB20]|uniref:DNA-3-methyladenine glycosylase family protein n=1 Tax=Paenibacillus sp. DMB20 TaxID=1642570 RepID=UPI00062790AC|nr:DNA-3-methyladenine glycosylase [Paenibacillus sp. DMB20]KKO52416.1 DNA-3-methyladenine glycosylase [Paenibacillus sp. DMB20]
MNETWTWQEPEKQIKLSLPLEFSFSQNLNYLADAAGECLYRIQDNALYKALPIGEQIYVAKICEAPESPGMLVISFLGGTYPEQPSEREAVASYVRDWFDLNADLGAFYEMAGRDPLLKATVDAFYGLRSMGIPDLFEAICWGILGQQINLSFAFTLKRRLVEAYGKNVTLEGETYHVFPTPETIAALSVLEMEELRMTVKKREYLIGVAKLLMEGELSKEALLQMGDHQKIEKKLVGIRGIGPWTANYVLMRCLRIPTAFPIDDVGLQNAVKHALGLEQKPTRQELLKLAAGWKNWESYATFYLWRLLY